MDDDDARARFASGRVGHLATVGDHGRPHVIPCCYALDGETVYWAVDAKPKRTTALKRLDNIRREPGVELVVDHYDDGEWSALWWVRAHGDAHIVDDPAVRRRALALLGDKYQQYRETPPEGPVVAIQVTRWRAWEATALG